MKRLSHTPLQRLACCIFIIFVTGFMAACSGSLTGLVSTLTPYPTVGEIRKLDIVCADYIAPAMQLLASTYQRQNPDVLITIVKRADTLGYPLLLDGDIDVAVLSWLPNNLSKDIWATPLAYDGLVIIVHPQNGVPGLTLNQVQKLYQGQVENWEEWGGLPGVPQLFSRENASGEFLYLQNRIMREIRISLNASLATDTGFMIQYVSQDPLAVGYISSSRLSPEVRALAIEGIPPSQETISAGIYPLTRVIFIVTHGEPTEPARGFIQWVLGYEGQNFLVNQGFVDRGTD